MKPVKPGPVVQPQPKPTIQQPKPPVVQQPNQAPPVTNQHQYQATQVLGKLDQLDKKKEPIFTKLDENAKKINDANAAISKTKAEIKNEMNKPNPSEERIRKLKEAQAQQEQKREGAQLRFTETLNDKVTHEVIGSMRSSCQDLAGNPCISGATLKGRCSAMFDRNDPRAGSLEYYNMTPVVLPAWRNQPGPLSPFPPGSVPPKSGLTGPRDPDVIQAPDWWVPPVGPSSPLPGQD